MKRSTVAVLALVAGAFSVIFASAALATEKPTKEQEALMQRERDNAQAWLKKDAKAVAAWDADDYIYTSFDGSVSDKAADLATLKAGTSNFTTVDVDDMKAMVFRDTGVVVGRYTMKGTYAGTDMSGVFRFTDTYVKRDGRWQCVASQITRVATP
jgi:ketosteroid isomerase-like protein